MNTRRKATFGGAIRLVLWLVLVTALLFLLSVPTSIDIQMLLNVICVGIVLVLRPFSQNGLARLVLLGTASVLVMRYWFWRLFETLPGMEDPVSFTAAILLFAVETYGIGIFILSGFIMTDPIERDRPKPVPMNDLPSVDILVPSMNEPRALLAVTLAACKNVAYPDHLKTVILCDDGGTDARCNDPDHGVAAAARERRRDLQELCAELDVVYMTRAENRGAKAGNINEALQRLDGALVAIFDADHAPTPDFLARTVGHFGEDPQLFLVQTPHFFLNADPVARNLRLPETCPPENEMFYNQLHKGLDRWDGTFFCGSAALLRRTALDEAGGIAGRTITEDAETALAIHAKGWRSLYVNHPMIAGLQPETFASFLQQRGRWATGMVQLMMTRNPVFMRGLSLWQRLCYVNSMSFWIFPFVRILLLLAPLLYLFFGLELLVTTATEAVVYMAGYLAVSYLVQNALFASVRWPFISEIYEIAQAPYLMRAVVGAVLRPRTAKFKVTSKDEVVDRARISDMHRPLVLLFALLAVGVGVAGWRWIAFPGDHDILKIVGSWAVFNLILVGAALRSVVEQRQRRRAPRVAVNMPARAASPCDAADAVAIPAQILDISTSGARAGLLPGPAMQGRPRIATGELVNLTPEATPGLPTPAPILGRVANLRTEDGRLVLGLAFEHDQTPAAFRTLAGVLHGDSRRWQALREARSRPAGLIGGTAFALWLSLAGITATLSAILRGTGRRAATISSTMGTVWDHSRPIEAQAFVDLQGPEPGFPTHPGAGAPTPLAPRPAKPATPGEPGPSPAPAMFGIVSPA